VKFNCQANGENIPTPNKCSTNEHDQVRVILVLCSYDNSKTTQCRPASASTLHLHTPGADQLRQVPSLAPACLPSSRCCGACDDGRSTTPPVQK